MRGLLAAGDPNGEAYDAWIAEECLRDLYTMADDPAVAARWRDRLTEGLEDSAGRELRGMARTLRRWPDQILAWHSTGASNGPAEALNLLIKKTKRVSSTASASSPTTGSASFSTPEAVTGTALAADPAQTREAGYRSRAGVEGPGGHAPRWCDRGTTAATR